MSSQTANPAWLSEARGVLPALETEWSAPIRGYEMGPGLYKVTAATGACVLSIYGSTQGIADQRWNEFIRKVHAY